ncbi:glycoside hydrolase domain-containing protein [Flavivirga spongiicola]|uniref:GEVED domain-containing protein n=1 Tax=Flavivirga spongiicola TaxID=421621 RepID=A0ABU7XZH6_9FLAO|nr:glycoside hydrolase domain-containing protein [Flavivirga sp. MEBiC05379]MDO5980953.1 GEVED domain-containing protein [Flavivirga sp. MEBiC05379]
MNLRILLFFLSLSISVTSYTQTIKGSYTSKFKRYQKNESFSGTQTQNWNTVAWKGDRIHKQIVLWSTSNINGLSYTVSNLVKGGDQISSTNIKLRFGQYIKGDPEARTCSEYPTHSTTVEIIDALSDVTTTSLSASDPLKLWLTIDIPNTAVAGVYTGTVTVNGGAAPLVFNISVNVVNYTLPDVVNWDFHLDLWQFPTQILNHYNTANPGSPMTIWSDEHFDLFEPGYRILADMGQKGIAAQIKDGALGMPSMIRWIRKTNGTWEYDFTAFDKYVTTLMSWGITKQIDCFSPVGWNETVIPYWNEATNSIANLNAAIGSTTYNTRWDHFLDAFKTFLDSKGWFNKTVLYLDEVEQSKLNNVFSMVQNNNSAWKIGIAHTAVLSASNSSQLYDASGILGTTSTTGRTGKITTFYTSCTQVHPNSYVASDTNLAEMTWMGWHATKEGLDGYLRWAYDNWRSSDPFNIQDGAHTAGDFAMVYRNSNNSPSKYLPSLRLIMLRDGIQDFEKLKILKTQLESASDDYSQQQLAAFTSIINAFDNTSGPGAETLVKRGQEMIEELVLGTFSYCKANGEADTSYYVSSLTTTGGINNINFSTSQYPTTGYEYHTATKLSIPVGGSFTLELQNSAASNCARTAVWIDWNDDEDFEDTGEMVFSGGTANTCSNTKSYTMPITAPNGVLWGEKRMRIQVKKSDLAIPAPCGTIDKTGTVDFNLELLDPHCVVTGTGDYNVASVVTTGGTKNINYTGGAGSNNYTAVDEKLKIGKGDTFNLSVSNGNGWSRSIVWVDWNADNDFADAGERLTPLSPEKVSDATVTYDMDITVPSNAITGAFKMRIVSGDAWTYENAAIPSIPCGIPTPDSTLENSAIKDFIIDTSPVLAVNDIKEYEDIKIFPNPLKHNKLTIKLPKIRNESLDVVLFNIRGQVVHRVKLNAFKTYKNIVFSNELANGFYFVKIRTKMNEIITKKLLIAK